jgi:hypothetical protein
MSARDGADSARVGTSVPPPGHVAKPLAFEQHSPPPPQRGRSKLIAGAGIAILAAVAGLVFLLFGSGGTPLASPVAQAATLSSSTPGYRMHMTMQMSSSALPAPITATATGVVDLRDHATAMSMVMDLGNEPQVLQQLGSSTMRVDMIMDGASAYVKLPAAVTSQLPASGRQWIEVDLAKLSGVPGLSSLANNPTSSDPSQTLRSLESVSGNVVDLGPARVDNVDTTHYRAELSIARVAGSLPAAERSVLEQALPTGDFPVDVWIDVHHLVRRFVTSLDLALPTGENMQETATVDLSDYGPQSRPATPPPDQVMDLSNLVTAAAG